MRFSRWTRITLALAAGLSLAACARKPGCRPVEVSLYDRPIRVACVGDSITLGAGIQDSQGGRYPSQLAKMLGEKWDVQVFGSGGSTLLKKGDKPYWDQQVFEQALAFKPDVVTIKLGTNDSKPRNWHYQGEFVDNYEEMIHRFQALDPQPIIYLCYPAPAFPGQWGINDQVIREEIIPRINTVARKTKAPVIDLYTALRGHGNLFPDQIHPDVEGSRLIAQQMFECLTGQPAP